MNRPIKFRQWAQNKFYYWGVGVGDNTFVGPASGGSINAANTKHQQFTGLLDRNGKEIYEGDVVKTHWQYDGAFNQDYTVTGKVVFDSEVSGFVIFKDEDHVLPFHSLERDEYFSDQTEVIGNIYEHPHLLEPPC